MALADHREVVHQSCVIAPVIHPITGGNDAVLGGALLRLALAVETAIDRLVVAYSDLLASCAFPPEYAAVLKSRVASARRFP